MRRYFVDSWFFIALTDRRDSHFTAALALNRTLSASALVTTDAVLTELLAFYADDSELRRVAAASTRRVLHEYIVVPSDRLLFLRALDRYEHRPDKEYSLVDCMSMSLMRERGITHVLTNDHHFRQEGFTVINE